ncbi:unnamed protein product [Closterium sp. NIES-64]|nr:unnamed protein product [Closterium sp. NIES-64]
MRCHELFLMLFCPSLSPSSSLQVKVLREADRVGPDGKPQSKGAAFIEFSEHQHAVAALRALNNHPTIFSRDARPIVEFAIENVSIVKQQQHTVRQQSDRRQVVRQQQKQNEAGATGLGKARGAKRKPEEGEALAVGDAEGSPAKKKQKQVNGGKGQGQQEKRQGEQQERHGKGPGKDVKGHAGAEVQAGAAAEQQSVGVKAPGGVEWGGVRGSGKAEAKIDTRRGEAAAAVMEARRAQAALAGLGGSGGGERGKVRSKKVSEHQELVDELDRLVAAYRAKNYG